MQLNPFKPKSDEQLIDAMIAYVTFIKNICQHAQIPGAVLTLTQTIDQLELTKKERCSPEIDETRKSA